MPEPYWKRIERDRRELLGLERDVHLGESGADGRSEWLVMEVKCREALPKWLTDAHQQAARRADGFQLPLVLLHEKGKHWQKDLIVMSLGDFINWFGGVPQEAHQQMLQDLAEVIREEK